MRTGEHMKKLLLSICFTLWLVILCANQIESRLALDIAKGLFTQMGGAEADASTLQEYSSEPGSADIYIIRFSPKGFVILAADDRSVPVLAYSLDSDFPMQDLPPAVKWLLSEYANAVAESRKLPDLPPDPAWQSLISSDFSAYENHRDVGPLLTTTWNQNYPYNYSCPVDAVGPGGRVYAGCVATAMAQVLRYWGHPITGFGSHSYSAPGYGFLTVNFGATTYNWGNMPNSVYTVNTDVANLIYHCAVSVNTAFSPTGSGAYVADAEDALESHFRYHPSARYEAAAQSSAAVWAGKLRLDLDAGRPILYRGQSYAEAHAWVIDGYQLTNQFHCNWGWGGSANGYFLLSNLNPASYNLSQSQAAVLGLYPLAQGNLQGVVTSGVVPLADAVVTIAGRQFTTEADGSYLFNDLNTGSHDITVCKEGYYQHSESAQIIANETTTLNFNLSEPLYPPDDLQAELVGDDVLLSWETPVAPILIDSLAWGDGAFSGAYGFDTATSFEVAQRWDQTDLSPYYLGQLTEVQIYPCHADCSYTIKVWTGGNSANPGTLVYSQTLANPQINSWNTVVLPEVIDFPEHGDLWVGYSITTQGGFPVAYDAGPAIDGKGNMFGMAGNWASMLYYGPQYDFNWLIRAVISYTGRSVTDNLTHAREADRELTGYRLWRFGDDEEDDPQSWTLISPETISGNTYVDPRFSDLPLGTYKWAVKAVYTSTATSQPAISNHLIQGMAAPISPEVSIASMPGQILLTWPAVVSDIHGYPISRVQYRVYAHVAPDFPAIEQYLLGSTRDRFFIHNSMMDRMFYKVQAVANP